MHPSSGILPSVPEEQVEDTTPEFKAAEAGFAPDENFDDHELAHLLPVVSDESWDKESGVVQKDALRELLSSNICAIIVSVGVGFFAVVFVVLLLIARPWQPAELPRHDGETLLSNGTHPWRNTVLMVSLDGLRGDYVNRNLTTHLHDISLQGLRAEYMKPIFPTLTFPNHWSLMTGLYAESHGIVANTFWDPVDQKTFQYTDPARSWDAKWWFGEPIWATAVKAGKIVGNIMWIGPPVTQEGIAPSYYVPFENHVSMTWKHDRIFHWLDLPFEKRPQLITVYEPSIDQAGHKYGPDSQQVDDALIAADKFAHSIHQSLAARNLSHIVDVIFVSDHGMTDTSALKFVYLDDILGDGFSHIEHSDGSPAMGLRFSENTNTTEMLRRLMDAAEEHQHKAFEVYTKETMPERFHFSHNERIAPIHVVPYLGWVITDRKRHPTPESGQRESLGNHGYDNEEPAMRAMFVADGPFSKEAKLRQTLRPEGKNASATIEPLVIDGFNNVEIYGLVAKLLGLTPAKNNGTEGFWDAYID